MFFVIEKPRFERMLAIADEAPVGRGTGREPFVRIEARENRMSMAGPRVTAEFSVTVYEPGVLFLRAGVLRRLLRMMPIRELKMKHVAFQVSADGLRFADVKLPFSVGDMLLYPDCAGAPDRHPEDRMDYLGELELEARDEAKGTLFEGLG